MENIGKIKKLLLNNIDEYEKHYTLRSIEKENIRKVLACRTPLYGNHTYYCEQCSYELIVPHSCKSRFCSVCGYKATEDWINSRFAFLLDCWYHHVVATVPHFIQSLIKYNRTPILNLFSKCAADTIQNWANQRGYEVGMVSFFHSFGSELQFHNHFHFLVTAGGLREDGSWYYTDVKMPGHILMPIFKAKFIAGLKELIRSGLVKTDRNINQLFYQLNNLYHTHWQFYTEKITKHWRSTLLYIVRYAKKMIISEQRIIDIDDKIVTFLNGKKNVRVCETLSFIQRILQHIPEKHFKLIKYYGFYAHKSSKKYEKANKYWNTLKKHVYAISWRDRQRARDKKDPMKCPRCEKELKLKSITYPLKWIYLKWEQLKIANNVEIQSKIQLEYG